MAYDFLGGLSTITLKRPIQPVKVVAPDPKILFLHGGENEGQYQSFIEAVSALAQAFKFLSAEDQAKYQHGVGTAYSNLEFSPDASDWDLLCGVNGDDGAILDGISYFDWDAIKSIGAGQSFYQIAKSGAISGYTDEQAFDLMCSMAESKERVFSILHEIFGDSANLTDDNAVIDNISAWLSQYTEVDPHNLGILKMFFGMQSDFINTLDAYMNCETYWGSDLLDPQVDFSDTLRAKVESYIASLTGDSKTAAESLEAMWFSDAPRYDKVGDTRTEELDKTEGSWVKFFQDKMDKFSSEEVARVIIGHIMNRSANQKYIKAKKQYENDKDELIQDEMATLKIQSKNSAESKKLLQALLSRSSKASRSSRAAGKRSSVPARRSPVVRGRTAVSVRKAPVAFVPKHLASRAALKSAPSQHIAAPRVKAAPKAQIKHVQAKKDRKDPNKVI